MVRLASATSNIALRRFTRPEPGAQLRVGHHPGECVGQGLRVPRGDDQSVDPVGQHLGDPTDRRRHDRQPDARRLHEDHREAFLA